MAIQVPNELSYVVVGDSYANLNFLDIWIKFASYLRPEEVAFINELKTKNVSQISCEAMRRYQRINNQIEMSKLLVKYKNEDCTKEEHDLVFNFMHQSLKGYISTRLSKIEKEKASNLLSFLETKKLLNDYIASKEEKMYEDLSIFDAYVLFFAKEKLYEIEQKELNEKIYEEKRQRDIKLHRSLLLRY